MAGEAPDVAEISAGIKGRRRRAVSQSVGPEDSRQTGRRAQPTDNPADCFSGESYARGWLGSVEAMEERALFVASSSEPTHQGGRGLIR
jgi:hypothetical protein